MRGGISPHGAILLPGSYTICTYSLFCLLILEPGSVTRYIYAVLDMTWSHAVSYAGVERKNICYWPSKLVQ